MYTIKELYDLDHTLAKDYLSQFTYPWEALKGIKDMILELGPTLGEDYEEVSENVWVHKTAKVFPSAYLGAPCIIGPNTEVRHGAFIRSSALQLHNAAIIACDEEACGELTVDTYKYFLDIEKKERL